MIERGFFLPSVDFMTFQAEDAFPVTVSIDSTTFTFVAVRVVPDSRQPAELTGYLDCLCRLLLGYIYF